jgi:hypothetical protein
MISMTLVQQESEFHQMKSAGLSGFALPKSDRFRLLEKMRRRVAIAHHGPDLRLDHQCITILTSLPNGSRPSAFAAASTR